MLLLLSLPSVASCNRLTKSRFMIFAYFQTFGHCLLPPVPIRIHFLCNNEVIVPTICRTRY